jgi:hypothetical protein
MNPSDEEPVVPIWFVCWALFVTGVVMLPEGVFVAAAQWMFSDLLERMGDTLGAEAMDSMLASQAATLRGMVLVFAGLYLVVRWLLRRSIREAGRVERGSPL